MDASHPPDDTHAAQRELAAIAPQLDPHLDRIPGPLLVAEAKLLYLVAREVRDGAIVCAGSSGARPAVALGRGSVDGPQAPVYAVGGAPAGDDEAAADARAALGRALVIAGLEAHVRVIEIDARSVAQAWNRPIGALWLGSSPAVAGRDDEFGRWAPHLRRDAFVLVEHRHSAGPDGHLERLAELAQLNRIETVGRVSLFQIDEGATSCATA